MSAWTNKVFVERQINKNIGMVQCTSVCEDTEAELDTGKYGE